jgi:DNA (cytosine-5)-methyltransferase 1
MSTLTTTARPRVLDLFCCQGGAGTGYHRAGFDVYGVDIDPQPRYPFPFHQGDALNVLARLNAGEPVDFTHPDGTVEWLTLADFAAAHGSPPCQGYSTITPDKSRHPLLIVPTRELLIASGLPYVIENVEGARRELHNPVKVCGSGLGLAVRRHRYFETNAPMLGVPCAHGTTVPIGVYGDHAERAVTPTRPTGTSRGVRAKTNAQASAALGGVAWMDWRGMAECIPPVYTEHIGAQLLAAADLAPAA